MKEFSRWFEQGLKALDKRAAQLTGQVAQINAELVEVDRLRKILATALPGGDQRPYLIKPWPQAASANGHKPTRHPAIVTYIKKHPGATTADLAAAFKLTEGAVYQRLLKLPVTKVKVKGKATWHAQ